MAVKLFKETGFFPRRHDVYLCDGVERCGELLADSLLGDLHEEQRERKRALFASPIFVSFLRGFTAVCSS